MKIVHYKDPVRIEVGRAAIVYPMDHTSPLVSNKHVVYTSIVMQYDKPSGVFVTMNSVYVPLLPDKVYEDGTA